MLKLILTLFAIIASTRQDELQKFIESNPECLVLFYSDPSPNFLRISQHFTNTGFPIKIHEVNSNNYEEMYDKYKLDYYPMLRFYLGHIDLYVDYLGDLTESEEDIEEADDEPDSLLLENLNDFLDSRISNSYKDLDLDGQEKFKDAMMNDKFSVIFVGEESDGCFRVFETLSKVNERDGFFRVGTLTELSTVQPDIAEKIKTRDVKAELFMKDAQAKGSEGLFLVSNFEDKLHVTQLCSQEMSIKYNTQDIIKANKLVKDNRFPQLKHWYVKNDAELASLKLKFVLVFYEPFFNNAVVSEANKRFFMNLYDDVKEKIRKFNYYDGVVPILHIDNSCAECTEYFKSIVGQSHQDSFLYFFEIQSRGSELKEVIKYRFILENMYKVKFNIRGFLSTIRDEKIKEFYRSELVTKTETNTNRAVEKANTNFLIDRHKNKNKRTEVYFCYKDTGSLKEFEKVFSDLKAEGIKLYGVNLQHNEIPKFIAKKQDPNGFILLKKKNKKMFKVVNLGDKPLADLKVELFGNKADEAMEEDL